jgi:hypothetical protein
MSKDIVKQAMEMFDTVDKWNAFLNLIAKKDEIRNQWFLEAKNQIVDYFSKNVVDNWSYSAWGVWDIRWYISSFTRDSLCLYWNGGYSLNLWVNSNVHNSVNMSTLLQTPKYAALMTCFDRVDTVLEGDNKLIERGNFSFECQFDGNFNSDQLSWYAGHETDKFVRQLVDKVERLRKNPEITALLMEINKVTKK